jgi:hypothetical protein
MANKNKNISEKSVQNYVDLFYMTPAEIPAKDIAALLKDTKEVTVELWEDMNILELELTNKNTVDFEPLEVSFKDPSDVAFVKNRNIRTIFAIHLCEDDLKAVIPYFERIIETYSGFLCADSENFMPVYAGTSKK